MRVRTALLLGPLVLGIAASVLPLTALASSSQEPGAGVEAAAARDDSLRLAEPENYFAIVDIDGDGSISAREARWILGYQRRSFLRFDRNADARVDLVEFRAEYGTFLARLGVIESAAALEDFALEPTAEPVPLSPTDEVLAKHDRDGDGALGRLELRSLARELALLPLLPSITRVVDSDGDGLVSRTELDALPATAWAEISTAIDPVPPAERERPALPPAKERRMDPLKRLDFDDDGYLTFAELVAFAPDGLANETVAAILEGLDNNGDQKLSLVELEVALGR